MKWRKGSDQDQGAGPADNGYHTGNPHMFHINPEHVVYRQRWKDRIYNSIDEAFDSLLLHVIVLLKGVGLFWIIDIWLTASFAQLFVPPAALAKMGFWTKWGISGFIGLAICIGMLWFYDTLLEVIRGRQGERPWPSLIFTTVVLVVNLASDSAGFILNITHDRVQAVHVFPWLYPHELIFWFGYGGVIALSALNGLFTRDMVKRQRRRRDEQRTHRGSS